MQFETAQLKNSPMREIDPRVKLSLLFLFSLSLMLTSNWKGLLVAVFFVLLLNLAARISFKAQWKIFLTPIWFYFIVTVIHSFQSEGTMMLPLHRHYGITLEGILKGLFFSGKIAVLILLVPPVLSSTHSSEWAKGVSAMVPHFWNSGKRFASALGIALRFMPMMLEEAMRIRTMQLSRGLKIGKGPIKVVKSMLPLFLPLIASSFIKADQISCAMQVRGFSLDAPRTTYKPLKLNWTDYIVLLLTLFLSVQIPYL